MAGMSAGFGCRSGAWPAVDALPKPQRLHCCCRSGAVMIPRLLPWLAGLLALLAIPAMPVQAEVPATPQPRQITVADGLPSSNINAFAEDGFGYLWLASRDGLARFDGRNYRIWRANDGLRDNLVWSLHVDARNRLWVGTQNAGLAMLPAERDRFTFYDREHYPQIGSNTVWSITSTPDGSLWFGTSTAGLHRLAADGTLTRFMPVPGDTRSLPFGGGGLSGGDG